MSRDWKPGDVAMVTLPRGDVQATFYDTGNERGWWHGEGGVMDHRRHLHPRGRPHRGAAMIRTCAHPFCRTSLTEDDAVRCPHGLTFCEHCTWEEACSECAA